MTWQTHGQELRKANRRMVLILVAIATAIYISSFFLLVE